MQDGDIKVYRLKEVDGTIKADEILLLESGVPLANLQVYDNFILYRPDTYPLGFAFRPEPDVITYW